MFGKIYFSVHRYFQCISSLGWVHTLQNDEGPTEHIIKIKVIQTWKTNLLFCWLEFYQQTQCLLTALADTVFMYSYSYSLTCRRSWILAMHSCLLPQVYLWVTNSYSFKFCAWSYFGRYLAQLQKVYYHNSYFHIEHIYLIPNGISFWCWMLVLNS